MIKECFLFIKYTLSKEQPHSRFTHLMEGKKSTENHRLLFTIYLQLFTGEVKKKHPNHQLKNILSPPPSYR